MVGKLLQSLTIVTGKLFRLTPPVIRRGIIIWCLFSCIVVSFGYQVAQRHCQLFINELTESGIGSERSRYKEKQQKKGTEYVVTDNSVNT